MRPEQQIGFEGKFRSGDVGQRYVKLMDGISLHKIRIKWNAPAVLSRTEMFLAIFCMSCRIRSKRQRCMKWVCRCCIDSSLQRQGRIYCMTHLTLLPVDCEATAVMVNKSPKKHEIAELGFLYLYYRNLILEVWPGFIIHI